MLAHYGGRCGAAHVAAKTHESLFHTRFTRYAVYAAASAAGWETLVELNDLICVKT